MAGEGFLKRRPTGEVKCLVKNHTILQRNAGNQILQMATAEPHRRSKMSENRNHSAAEWGDQILQTAAAEQQRRGKMHHSAAEWEGVTDFRGAAEDK